MGGEITIEALQYPASGDGGFSPSGMLVRQFLALVIFYVVS
jgi:hypothetical protein